jgi:hypothetical protein
VEGTEITTAELLLKQLLLAPNPDILTTFPTTNPCEFDVVTVAVVLVTEPVITIPYGTAKVILRVVVDGILNTLDPVIPATNGRVFKYEYAVANPVTSTFVVFDKPCAVDDVIDAVTYPFIVVDKDALIIDIFAIL